MNKSQSVCIKEFKALGSSSQIFDKDIKEGHIYMIEKVSLDKDTCFYHIEDEAQNYLGIIMPAHLENFLSIAEWRDKQIDKILDE
jgi:hypothetical protein